jgi:hypothetical protein
MAGSSARFNDIMHTQPSTMKVTETTIELVAWQTEVTGVLDNTRPMPLIAPKHSFSGVKWWIALELHLKALLDHPKFQNADFILPTPTSDHMALIPRPCSNNQALRWLRQLLVTAQYPADKAGKLTLPSFRVWMADLAYQHGISRDKRRYIGRWAAESTADIYTREHRIVICQIWDEVTQGMALRGPAAASGAEREVPEDLNHKHYNLQQPSSAAPGADSEEEKTPYVSPHSPKDTASSDNPTPPKRVKTWIPAASGADEPIPADMATANTDGPYTPAINIKPNGNTQTHKVHLFTVHRRAVGCGWEPKLSQITNLDEHEWIRRHRDRTMTTCIPCFRRYTWPSTWKTATATDHDADADSQTSNSSASDAATDSDADSASEAEAIRLRPLTAADRPPELANIRPTEDTAKI